jgi:glutathione S-transferase
LVLERRASFVPTFPSSQRFAEGEAAQTAVKETGAENRSGPIARRSTPMVQGNDWVMGREYTLVPILTLWFSTAGARSGHPMKELSAYTAWQERMMKRPTVQKSVEAE